MHLEKIKEALFSNKEVKTLKLKKEIVFSQGVYKEQFLFPILDKEEKKGIELRKKKETSLVVQELFGEEILEEDIKGFFKSKKYFDFLNNCRKSIAINTNFTDISNMFGWDTHYTQLDQIQIGFPEQANFFQIFKKRLKKMYDLVIYVAMVLINEFFYSDAELLIEQGMKYQNAQLQGFRIAKILHKEIVNTMINQYNMKTN